MNGLPSLPHHKKPMGESPQGVARKERSKQERWSKRKKHRKSIGHGEGGVLSEAEEASICASVLAKISDRVLADAAFRVKAYARSAMYLERDMRARHDPNHRGVARGSNCYGMERVYQIPFYQEEVEYLRRIFAHIDEPDTMQGLMYLRSVVQKQEESSKSKSSAEPIANLRNSKYGHDDMRELREAIIDHEHASEWDEALTCYEQLLDHYQKFHVLDGPETNVEIPPDSSSKMPPPDLRSPHGHTPIEVRRNHASQAGYNYESNLHNIYNGIMRNLGANSGHHETLLHHAIGAMQHGDSSLSQTVIPFAMEASWRLGRWDLLENLTEKEIEHRQSSIEHPWLNSMGVEQTQRSFMINVSEALLSLRIGDVNRLQMALSTARKDVMGALSAASMESYEQAYPLVLKLHVLHEIEESQHMQMLSSAAEKRKFRKDCRWDERLAATRPSVRDHEFLLAVRRSIFRIQDEISSAPAAMPSKSEPNVRNIFHTEEANGWIHLARICTAAGDQRMASSAVTHAMLLDDGNALVEKAKFYRAKNNLHRALILLDAGMPNTDTLDRSASTRKVFSVLFLFFVVVVVVVV